MDIENLFIYLSLCTLESCACLNKNLIIFILILVSDRAEKEQELATHLKHVLAVATTASASPAASMPIMKHNGILRSQRHEEKVGDMYLR